MRAESVYTGAGVSVWGEPRLALLLAIIDGVKVILIIVALLLFAVAGVCLIASIVLFVMAKKRRAAAEAGAGAVATNVAAPVPQPAPRPVTPRADDMLSPVTMPGNVDTAATVVVKLAQAAGSIVWLSGPLEGRRIPLTDEGFFIGREATVAELVIESSSVSKRHAWIGLRNGRAVVADAGSTNGTFLDGATKQRITEHELRRGDVVVIADDVARFRYEP